MSTERTRRLVHFSFGGCALLLPLLGPWGSAGLAGAAVLYNAYLAPRLRLDRGYRRPGERGISGLVTYPLAVLLLCLLAPLPVAAGAWVVLATLDPVAAEAGEALPRPRVPGNPRKSLSGTAVGILAATATCAAILRYFDVAPWPGALAAAAAGGVAEALPLPWDDNLVLAAAAALALLPFVS